MENLSHSLQAAVLSGEAGRTGGDKPTYYYVLKTQTPQARLLPGHKALSPSGPGSYGVQAAVPLRGCHNARGLMTNGGWPACRTPSCS